ncbi:Flp pilus assembly protein CpaB [Luteithermobacter gelatinilyticus]|uniref:Flp pilus assembly protein CpaB n=1 Tax=Luteithermobacter gelatinilyticus TaxID=2582913 RepID=UPI0011071F18|nr:Flp pilus assembly protein CpaB [Luteithermobacter gelatinilyticus]
MTINMRSIIFIVIALVIAGITAFMARSLIQPAAKPVTTGTTVQKAAPSGVQVLVASRHLATGHLLKAEDLTWQSWPDAKLHESYIRKSKDVRPEDFAGAVVRSMMIAGEPVTKERVIKPGNHGFMAAVLAPGKRAVSIRVNITSSISGFIFPGDYVDIILTHKSGGAQVSETVMKNVRVIATDQRTASPTQTPSAKVKTVTFEVTPEEAEKITLLEKMGSLSMSLRSLAQGGDGASSEVSENDMHDDVTWDSEVSKLLYRGAGGGASKNGTHFSLKVVRGNKVQNMGFVKQGK